MRTLSRACRLLAWLAAALSAAMLLLEVRSAEGEWFGWSPLAPFGLGAVALLFFALTWWLERLDHRRRHDTPESLLAPGEEERVVAAIRRFEGQTSGEIRVHLEHRCAIDPLQAATRAFERLGMTGTRQRNAVLFYVAACDRKLAVVGDRGIDEVTGPEFWAVVVRQVEERFRKGDFVGGLLAGIDLAGLELARHFPPDPADVNELPDGLSR